jgi:hypothetical protein
MVGTRNLSSIEFTPSHVRSTVRFVGGARLAGSTSPTDRGQLAHLLPLPPRWESARDLSPLPSLPPPRPRSTSPPTQTSCSSSSRPRAPAPRMPSTSPGWARCCASSSHRCSGSLSRQASPRLRLPPPCAAPPSSTATSGAATSSTLLLLPPFTTAAPDECRARARREPPTRRHCRHCLLHRRGGRLLAPSIRPAAPNQVLNRTNPFVFCKRPFAIQTSASPPASAPPRQATPFLIVLLRLPGGPRPPLRSATPPLTRAMRALESSSRVRWRENDVRGIASIRLIWSSRSVEDHLFGNLWSRKRLPVVQHI